MTAALPHSDTAARLRGIGLICIALIVFALLDALAKYASQFVPVLEIVWVRFLGQTVLLLAVFRPWRNLGLYRSRRPVAQLLRSGALFGSTIFNFIALRHLQLDQTATIGFATAFVTAGLAGPMLGEWVGPRRWAAIVVGFVGVLIVIGPPGSGFNPAMLYSVGAMLCYSLYNLTTRLLAATEPPAALLLFSGFVPAVLLTPFAAPVVIVPPSGWVGAAVLGTALCGAVGHWILIHAFRLAPASLLAPFTYTQILWMPAPRIPVFRRPPRRQHAHRCRHHHRQRPLHPLSRARPWRPLIASAETCKVRSEQTEVRLPKVEILSLDSFPAKIRAALDADFDRHDAGHGDKPVPPQVAGRVRGLARGGHSAVDKALIASLPKLEVIANFGVGYDGIDLAAAAERGIVVTNTPDVLTEEVADTALGLLLMTVRELPAAERHLRAGRWASAGPWRLTPTMRDRKVGIVGLGRIGMAIARRLDAMQVPVAYHARHKRHDAPYPYYPALVELAAAVDTLILVIPGDASTRNLVDAKVLEALGANGVLINIGRGLVVDDAALIDALKNRTILAAGLDVFADEPNVPQELIDLPNTVLLPHVGSATVHTRNAMGQLMVDNLKSWFETGKPLTPVPETPWPPKKGNQPAGVT